MIDNPVTYWDTVPVPYQHGPEKHRLFLLDLLAEKEVHSLLDVGCGTGPIYELLIEAEEGRWDNITKYKGIDYSPNFINWAKESFGDDLFAVGDARNLQEPDNSWDCVLLMHALDHINDYQKAIAEATRVSKRYVLIVFWRDLTLDGEIIINDHSMQGKQPGEEPWKDTYLLQYSKPKLLEEFRKNNLRIVEADSGEILNVDNKTNHLFLLEKL